MPRKRASRRPSRIRHRRRGKSTKKSTEQTTIDAKRSVSIDNPAKQQVADMEDIAKQFGKLFPQQMEEAKALQKKKVINTFRKHLGSKELAELRRFSALLRVGGKTVSRCCSPKNVVHRR